MAGGHVSTAGDIQMLRNVSLAFCALVAGVGSAQALVVIENAGVIGVGQTSVSRTFDVVPGSTRYLIQFTFSENVGVVATVAGRFFGSAGGPFGGSGASGNNVLEPGFATLLLDEVACPVTELDGQCLDVPSFVQPGDAVLAGVYADRFELYDLPGEANGTITFGFDITTTALVPLPAGAALLGGPLAALAWRRRRS